VLSPFAIPNKKTPASRAAIFLEKSSLSQLRGTGVLNFETLAVPPTFSLKDENGRMKFHRAAFTSKSTYSRCYGRTRRLLMNQAAGFHPPAFILQNATTSTAISLFISQHFDELSPTLVPPTPPLTADPVCRFSL
jgi:hypothetical protein